MPKITTVLLDLDGTLIDTAPDMVAALDRLCAEEGMTPKPYDVVRPRVSDGSVALVELAFGGDLEEDRLEYLKQRYLELYEADIAVGSRLFDGMAETLDTIESSGRRWGVVTNKPGWLTLPLMQALGLAERASCIVSGDTTPNRKPHPEPMLHACELTDCEPDQTVYVGDALRDIEAGVNAGMRTIIARYGYIEHLDDIDNWGADHIIEHPKEVLNYL